MRLPFLWRVLLARGCILQGLHSVDAAPISPLSKKFQTGQVIPVLCWPEI